MSELINRLQFIADNATTVLPEEIEEVCTEAVEKYKAAILNADTQNDLKAQIEDLKRENDRLRKGLEKINESYTRAKSLCGYARHTARCSVFSVLKPGDECNCGYDKAYENFWGNYDHRGTHER